MSDTANESAGGESGESDVERQREDDPDAPGLGVVDDEDQDPPEPNEPA